MFLNEFETYNAQYEVGAKKISLRTSRPKIVKDENPPVKMERSHGNYDLYFNRQGILLYSQHIEKSKPFKILYGYSRMKRLAGAMKLSLLDNELISVGEFYYDEQGRIESEQCCEFYYGSLGEHVDFSEYKHLYSENSKVISMTNDSADLDEHTLYLTFDNNNRVIEDKTFRNEDEFLSWDKFEYNEFGVLIKQISLNEGGEQYGYYEYKPLIHGLSSGYKYTSDDINYEWEHIYEFNEKQAWIHEVMLNNGEPMWFHERKIIYFEK